MSYVISCKGTRLFFYEDNGYCGWRTIDDATAFQSKSDAIRTINTVMAKGSRRLAKIIDRSVAMDRFEKS